MKTLRELAKDYAGGKLDKDDYRNQRRELIQGIVAGDIEVFEQKPLPPLIPLDDGDVTQEGIAFDPLATTQFNPTITKKRQVPQDNTTEPRDTASASLATRPQNKQQNLIVALCVLIVLICIGLIVYLYVLSSPSDEIRTVSSETSSVAPVPSVQNPAEALLSSFLKTGDWREETIKKFELNWYEMNASDKKQALDSALASRLKNAINAQLVQEKAMISLGGTDKEMQKSMAKQQALIDFARSMGIDIQ